MSDALIAAIRPAVDDVAEAKGDKLDAAVRANVKRVVATIRSDAVKSAHVKVIGM
jgi:hypothetical protein